jgi:hypothetical protein
MVKHYGLAAMAKHSGAQYAINNMQRVVPKFWIPYSIEWYTGYDEQIKLQNTLTNQKS